MAGKAPISLQTARIPWVAILRIRGSLSEVKLRRNTSASSEGIQSTLRLRDRHWADPDGRPLPGQP